MMKPNNDLLTRQEAATLLGKPVKYLTNDQQKGKRVPFIRKGRMVFYKKEDIVKFSQRDDNRISPLQNDIEPAIDQLPPTVDLSRALFPQEQSKDTSKDKVIMVEGGYLKDGVIKMTKPEDSESIAPKASPDTKNLSYPIPNFIPNKSAPEIKNSPPINKYPRHNQGIESFKVSNRLSKDKLTEGIRPHISALHASNQKMKDDIIDLKACIGEIKEHMAITIDQLFRIQNIILDTQVESEKENDKGWVIRLCKS